MAIATDKSDEIKCLIKTKIPGALVEVVCTGDRHYTLTVISKDFEGLTQVKQHQLVYSAITNLMSGDNAPIHAIDRMDLRIDKNII